MEGVIHRAGLEADLPLVYDTWMRHVRDQRPWRDLPKHVFDDPACGYRRRVSAILDDGALRVAVDEQDENLVFAFIVHGPGPSVHFAYTKERFRKMGMFGALMVDVFGEHIAAGHPLLYTEKTQKQRQWNRLVKRYALLPNPRTASFVLMAEQGDGKPAVAMIGPEAIRASAMQTNDNRKVRAG